MDLTNAIDDRQSKVAIDTSTVVMAEHPLQDGIAHHHYQRIAALSGSDVRTGA
ncbi:MAG: hypothetical protein IPQ14_01935 [Candidatus Microthrix sp.]|uniref:hypothetical protein n=1 Tax=Candidatus Neomicrothrix sp. TaxID=2719034 RepID=UPI0025C68FA5|nr:hypothetical protein [Candidatus Microthrix sp.]MBL0203105.1 hypothetical protein [Candidatus Microthrix sp.]